MKEQTFNNMYVLVNIKMLLFLSKISSMGKVLTANVISKDPNSSSAHTTRMVLDGLGRCSLLGKGRSLIMT